MEIGRKALDITIRAIDAYGKTLLVDKVTTNDERSPPVYLLNEISDILSSCSLDLTQEIVEYTFRRLRHHNPQVKYKVLRFIKYTINRAGSAAYRKELQSYSATIRELFNYQGQADPFKGNALNQAVRDAAHEAIKAIFSSEASLPASKSISNRIEGFGNGNFSPASVRSYTSVAIDDGKERECLQHYGGNDYYDHGSKVQENVNLKLNKESEKVSSPEEELLDKVIASQGLLLQPTHECLQLFLSSAKTLDAVRIALALKARLQSPPWQVQFKALCALQFLLYQKETSLLQAIEANAGNFHICVQECLLSPQATLKKKAKEVLDSLQALRKVENHLRSPNMPIDDTLSAIESCNKESFISQWDNKIASFSSPSPVATSDMHQLVDLVSFQNDCFAQFQATETSPTSVMDDPFDGMCIYGSNESAQLPSVDDFLSGGWTDNNVDHIEASCVKMEHNSMPIRSPQYNAINQNLYESPALDNLFVLDIAKKGPITTGKSVHPSLDSKTYVLDSQGNITGLENLNSLNMFPLGMVGSSHSIGALQRYPGGTQGFQLGINNDIPNANGKFAADRHALGDTWFEEFGLSS